MFIVTGWTQDPGITCLFIAIVRVKIVFRKAGVGDWRFDYLSGSHLQNQVKSFRRSVDGIYFSGHVLIGSFFRYVIGCQD